MSVQANLTFLVDSADPPDKVNWTELQHLQYTLGIWDGVEGSPVRHRELPEKTWVPNDEWRSLSDIRRDSSQRSTTELKAEQRAWELAHDERKFGPFPPL